MWGTQWSNNLPILLPLITLRSELQASRLVAEPVFLLLKKQQSSWGCSGLCSMHKSWEQCEVFKLSADYDLGVFAESCVRSVVLVLVWLSVGAEQWMKAITAKGVYGTVLERAAWLGKERADQKVAFRAGMLRRRQMGRLSMRDQWCKKE